MSDQSNNQPDLQKMDATSVEDNWRTRGYSCDIWTDPPGRAWRDFVHDTDELFMLIDGEIEVHLDGKVFRPAIGEEIFIPAGQAHTVINVGTMTNHWYYGYRKGRSTSG